MFIHIVHAVESGLRSDHGECNEVGKANFCVTLCHHLLESLHLIMGNTKRETLTCGRCFLKFGILPATLGDLGARLKASCCNVLFVTSKKNMFDV